MRIFAVSDLHTDFHENWGVIQRLPDDAYQEDTLIVAGDIASQLEIIGATLAALRSKFRHVFYVPGNHELWVGDGPGDSIEKFFQILALCERLGVQTSPAQIGTVWIVALFSWYAADFDDDGHRYARQLRGWADFYSCRWPHDIRRNIARYFSELNIPQIQAYPAPVISFSHFVPRPELLPPRQFLFFKALPRVAGSRLIEAQIRQLRSQIHIFGHSHIRRDLVLEGIRYVQNPLSYPREKGGVAFPEKVIWEEES
ncbi:metallophosphoesterase [candidate division KSB3 bacterium]|uniref:Metallophosphoesterase n=1 Tax=candidate division KSB3 bacterium TaxID=2044937 RepID=A0A9D5Q546_9BACT|nr:metallophosphoesterase [candidate division KSB3 bacterium]MBD3323877.1 metallophosphoesterase [candidate division KSB3 bacterium]